MFYLLAEQMLQKMPLFSGQGVGLVLQAYGAPAALDRYLEGLAFGVDWGETLHITPITSIKTNQYMILFLNKIVCRASNVHCI